MSDLTAILLFARILSVFAADSSLCKTQRDGARIDGYRFLQLNARFDIQMTTLNLGVSYTPAGSPSMLCLSTMTIDKDDRTHRVTEMVHYINGTSEEWHSFSQTFEFESLATPRSEDESVSASRTERYNTMKSIEPIGAPTAEYTFKYMAQDCAVVEITSFKLNLIESEEELESPPVPAAAEARSEQQESGAKDCMLWVKPGRTVDLQNCCELFFSENCKPKYSDYQYTPGKCTVPEIRADL